ncbi:dipeptide epimerase [Tindallia californiensis]|uniref:Dipeptide epimerase n=1 Tax=Tindallia californiensis TaxID=159292 RepID=A0A1H3MFW4_9FIRM|nr:dipeptide epimerase [Tindallia californiensis]SDY75560.1 o-succinylbenzoate synthase/o-succinylbenzoate synthase,TIGR01928 [Tindallia californiensis]
MKIKDIQFGIMEIPLKKPFKTALRTANVLSNVVVMIETDTGNQGYGEAPPTGVITGDTQGSIIGAIREHIKKSLIDRDIADIENNMVLLNHSILGNTSAKAALDMALYDLYAQVYQAPLYQILGGCRSELITDKTISVNEPEEMVKDSLETVQEGYRTLKVKVGKNIKLDLNRLDKIRKTVGDNIKLRLDANQGWSVKEAIAAIKKMEERGFNIEFVEQPVKAGDIEGLKKVTDSVTTPIMADESVFSPEEALHLLQNRATDMINIKLMKAGGIHNALKICAIAETSGVECMVGCMLESKIAVTAAAHLAAAKKVVTKVDLDSPLLCAEDPISGGIIYEKDKIILPEAIGLGLGKIKGIGWKSF